MVIDAMKKFLSALFLLLAPLLAFAQDKAEPPVEHASTGVVVVFLVLFIGSIVAYGVYLWWKAKAAKPAEK